MLDFLARLHVLVLHFPIGLLALALLLEWLARRQDRPEWANAARIALFWGMITAVFAAFCGWLLGARGQYDPNLLFWHQWWGFATAALAVAAWIGRKKEAYFPLLVLCGGGLLGAGHFGGSLTHGADYLTEPLFPAPIEREKPVWVDLPPSAQVYGTVLKPILQKKCASCHGPGKAKGGLRLDSPENIQHGGEHGAVLFPGKPEESPLFQRAALPMADEKHMPPNGKPQLTPDELTLLKWWIAEGADFKKTLGDTKISPEVQAVFDRARAESQRNPVFEQKIEAAEEKNLENARAAGFAVQNIAADAPWLTVSAAGKKDLEPAQLAVLKKLRTQIAYLDLGNATFTDADMGILADLPNLARLNLAGTALTDAGLPKLAGLQFLETLNLSGTKVSDAGLQFVADLKNLHTLHVWNSDVSETGLANLRSQLPALVVNAGGPRDTASAPLTLKPPKIIFKRQVFDDTLQVMLDFPFKNVDLHYAFSPASPTSASPKFEGKALVIDSTTSIRVFAARKGWANSPIVNADFVRRKHKPQKVTLLTPTSPYYKAKGGATLADGILGEDRSDNTYLGWEGQHADFVLDFGQSLDFQTVHIRCLDDNSPWVFASPGFTAWISDDNQTWRPFVKGGPFPTASSMQPARNVFRSATAAQIVKARYLKIHCEGQLTNPKWHPSAGKKCWLFVSEVLVE